MNSDILRGHIDTIILYQLSLKDSYGYEINKDVQSRTNNRMEIKDATLYSAFRRLENADYILSYWGEEGTNARRRYYKITEKGRLYLKDNIKEWENVKRIIDILLGSERA